MRLCRRKRAEPYPKVLRPLSIKFMPLIPRQMLSQREIYTGVRDHATKKAFFSHTHRVQYSTVVLGHDCLCKPAARAKPNIEAEIWNKLVVRVLVKAIEAIASGREAFLGDLATGRNTVANAEAGVCLQETETTDSSMWKEPEVSVKTEMEAPRNAKQERVPASRDTNDLGIKSELGDVEDVRLDDKPKYKDGDDDDEWLNNLDSNDEGSLQRPSLQGHQDKDIMRQIRTKMGQLRTRNVVDRWIRFLRVEPGRSNDVTPSTREPAVGPFDR